jgi:hypothetical protein
MPPPTNAPRSTQWGDRAKALEWLDTSMRLRDP